MKKITQILGLGILFLFVTTLSLSAQKCKYAYNKIDPLTGEETKGTTFRPIYYCQMSFNKIGETYYVEMAIGDQGNIRDIIQKGDPVIFKLSNGEIVTITSQDEYIPMAYASTAAITTRYKAQYDIDSTILQKIAANPPIFFRMNIGSKVEQKEISAKDGKKISEAARCILQ